MADHTEFMELARELISADGTKVRLRTYSSVAPTDAWRPTRAVASETEVDAIFLGKGFGIEKMVSEELLARVSMVMLVPPPTNNADLSGANAVFYNSIESGIDWVEVLKPADQICLYMFGMKQ